jgi:hypothetical protein
MIPLLAARKYYQNRFFDCKNLAARLCGDTAAFAALTAGGERGSDVEIGRCETGT